MSWGVALRNAVGLGLGGIPSLLNAPPYARLAFNFLSGQLDPRITFSRTSNATLIGSNGTLQYAPHNLLTYSEQFDNAAWNSSAGARTVTANTVAAPDGTTTADTITADGTSAAHFASQAVTLSAVAHAFSVYVKKGTNDFVQLRGFSGFGGMYANFDVANGVVGSVGTTTGAIPTSSIQNVGNEWYRCTMLFTPSATSSSLAVYVVSSATSGSGEVNTLTTSIYTWGAQLNVGALQPYYQTIASAYYGPRFDYDPVTLAPKGLLIEEQRTNSIRNNTAQGAVGGTPGTLPTNWFIGNLAGLSTQVVAIGTESGVSYIDLRIFGTSTTTNFILNFEPTTQIPALQNQSWTGSFFVTYVAGTLTNVQNFSTTITERDSAGALLSTSTALRNLTNTPLIQNRYVNSYTLPTATAAYVTLRLDVGVAATSAIDITLRVGLPQLELGAFATSVIPTTTAAATRAADVLSITGANFSSWYNQAEGTTLVEAATLPNVTAAVVSHAISDGTFNNSLYGNFSGGNAYRGANVLDGGVGQTLSIATFTGITATNNTKDAFAYKLNDFAESCNGVATRTDSVGTVPVVNRLYIGTNWNASGNFLNGYIRSFKYYPTRLSNGQLQSLTFVPPTLWTPAQIPTAVWLDAADAGTITLNGSTVSQWADKSGNGRNVVQATASAQPTSGTRTLNSLNTLDFDGDDWLRYNTPFFTINTEWLLYSVIIFDSLTNGPVYVGVKGAQTTHMGWALSPGNQAIYNDVIGTRGLSNTGVISIGNAAIMGVQYDTTNITGIFNGTTQLSSAATFTADTANFVVGVHSNTATNFLDGAFGEIVFIQSSVSLSNRQKLEGYLAWKWGLQANLPVGHPYKAAAPTV